ncbi:MAG: GNAT family N-acetyltransferase, partial [Gemmatimonadota bacterium]
MRVQCRGLRAREYGVVREIIAGAFGDHVRDNPAALEQLEGEPWYDPDHLLVAEADGEVVSHLGVRDSGLWLGGRWFAAGLVGTVCTREELRGQGIGSELLRHAFGWMAQRGLALSLLHTNEQRYAFYERLGYRRAVIEQPRLMADLGRAGAAREAGVRAASAADAAALDEIYAATYGRATGAWARSGPFWERRIAGIPKLWSRVVRFAVAGHGSPRAYAAYEEAPG